MEHILIKNFNFNKLFRLKQFEDRELSCQPIVEEKINFNKSATYYIPITINIIKTVAVSRKYYEGKRKYCFLEVGQNDRTRDVCSSLSSEFTK